jgi:hypothetical protein
LTLKGATRRAVFARGFDCYHEEPVEDKRTPGPVITSSDGQDQGFLRLCKIKEAILISVGEPTNMHKYMCKSQSGRSVHAATNVPGISSEPKTSSQLLKNMTIQGQDKVQNKRDLPKLPGRIGEDHEDLAEVN